MGHFNNTHVLNVFRLKDLHWLIAAVKRRVSPRLIGVYTFTLAAPFVTASAQQGKVGAPLNETEQWVIARVQAGDLADLRQQFPNDESKRSLSARFIEDLLTDSLPSVKPHRRGILISGALIKEPINLINAEINHEVWLNNCTFQSWVSCTRAKFASDVSFDGSEFVSSVDFGEMRVGETACFRSTKFDDSVIFTTAEIANDFEGCNSVYTSKDKEVVFRSLKVGGKACFSHSVFEGPVNFTNADIHINLEACNSQFNSKKAINFYHLKVGGFACFSNSLFATHANFEGSEFGSDLEFGGANFQDPSDGTSFGVIKVGGRADFYKTIFAGPVYFIGAEVAGDFAFGEAQFQNKEKLVYFSNVRVGKNATFDKTNFAATADFENMIIAGDASFSGSKFAGDVFFNRSIVSTLTLAGSSTNAIAISKLDLTRMSVKQSLNLWSVHLQELQAQSLHVEGELSMRMLRIEKVANLSHGDFGTLEFYLCQWPEKKSKNLHLESVDYRYIQANDEQESASHALLLKIADQAAYSPSVYGSLERFFFQQGYRGDANTAFIEGNNRERDEFLSRYSFEYWWSWALWFIGYGRYPWRALIPCALFVALGWFLFKPHVMEQLDMDHTPHPSHSMRTPTHYHRFWYSLELFLPLIEFRGVDRWAPKRNYRFLRHYMRWHILAGWILVPIALAALTGIIK